MQKLAFLFLLFCISGNMASAQNDAIRSVADKKSSSITYSMKHPLHAWNGVSRDASSIILSEGKKGNIREVAVSVKVSSFDSKNANRDSHMLEVTEALKFPNLTFSGKVTSREGNRLKVNGELTFHGVSRPVSFEASVTEKGDRLEVSGNFAVTLTEFNIQRPTLMGLPVADEIQVAFSMIY